MIFNKYHSRLEQAQKLKGACPQGEMISEIKWCHLLTISGFSMFLILNFVQKQLTIFYMPYDFEWQKVMNGLSTPYLLIRCVVWKKCPRCWKYGYYQRALTLLKWLTCKILLKYGYIQTVPTLEKFSGQINFVIIQ